MAYVIQSPARPRQAPQDDGLPSPTAVSYETLPAAGDDSGQGLALIVLFTAAVLVVTGAVAFLALATSWWVLGVVFAVHVLVTVIVGTAIFTVMATGKQGRPGSGRASRLAA